MSLPARTRAPLILLFAAVLFLPRLSLPLLEPEEARYAEIPRQMLVEGHFLVPTLDGQAYLDKPPLLYWLVMASYRVFGISDAAARVVPVLSAWLTVVVVYGWGRCVAGDAVGCLAALLLTLFGDYVYRGPMLTMNGPLALWVTLSLAAGHVALQRGGPHRGFWIVSALACATGILMKGPIALVLVVVPLGIFSRIDRRLALPGWRSALAYLAILAAASGPWFLYMAWSEPNFLAYFIGKHHLERFTAPFDHAKPFWFYAPQLLIGLFPWSLAVGVLAWRSFRPRRLLVSEARVFCFASAWGILFFSIAGSKRPVYLVPVYPLLALALATMLLPWLSVSKRAEVLWRRTASCTGVALVVAVWLLMPLYSERFSLRTLVRVLDDEPGPIVCVGYDWESVGFYMPRQPVRWFRPGQEAELMRELSSRPQTSLIISTKVGGEFLRNVLASRQFDVRARNLIAVAGVVTLAHTIAGPIPVPSP